MHKCFRYFGSHFNNRTCFTYVLTHKFSLKSRLCVFVGTVVSETSNLRRIGQIGWKQNFRRNDGQTVFYTEIGRRKCRYFMIINLISRSCRQGPDENLQTAPTGRSITFKLNFRRFAQSCTYISRRVLCTVLESFDWIMNHRHRKKFDVIKALNSSTSGR